MKNKKRLWLCALAFTLLLGVAAPDASAQEKVDLVVLLDSSQSMFPYYNQVLEYVVSGALKEYMRAGDVFHLLSFAEATQIEIAQSLKTESDVKSALARLYLLYPLGMSTDLLSTLRYAYQYVDDLPEASAKRIILITDGMHAPLPGSPYASYEPEQVRAEIEKTIGRVKERGWQMSVVRVPFGRGVSSGGEAGPGESGINAPGAGDYLGEIATALGVIVNEFDPENAASVLEGSVGLLRVRYPDDLGTKDYAFKFPLELSNPGGQDLSLELNALLLPDGSDALAAKAFLELGAGKTASLSVSVRIPSSMEEGAQRLVLEPRFSDGVRVSPARSDMAIVLKRSPILSFFKNSARVLIFVGLLIVALALIILLISYVRSVHKRSASPVVDAVLDAQSLRESDRKQELSQGANAQAILAAAAQKPRGTILAPAADMASSAQILSAAAQSGHERDRLRILSEEAAKGDGSAARAALLLGTKREAQAALLPQAARPAYEYRGQVKKQGAARIILHVEGQNPNIGRRNIKTLHAGGRKTVGGRKSEFLVFLLPLPQHVADLHYDGESLTLVPRRTEFFPDYNGPIQDCLGQDIRVINARGKELFIRFERFVPPLDKINKLLHCLESPGV